MRVAAGIVGIVRVAQAGFTLKTRQNHGLKVGVDFATRRNGLKLTCPHMCHWKSLGLSAAAPSDAICRARTSSETTLRVG
jgi:hypothetical protein